MPTKKERDLEDALDEVLDVLEDHGLVEPEDGDDSDQDDRGN